MRVIAGSARSLKLKTPAGNDVRPTTDRIKETLFNIISPYIYGADFLDLFAGSGAIGIEALSRGADSCVFVEKARESISCINDNLNHTKLADKARVMSFDAVASVCGLYRDGKRFDIIFMDPPYNQKLEQKVLEAVASYNILKEDGMIIVEASADTEFDYLESLGYEMTREKTYGSNKHVFISVREDPHFYKWGIDKLVSVGVQSPTEINAPRGCAGIRKGVLSAEADPNPAPRLASES